ncbi:uncharacterized protein [Nicotiana tomentosiformis]|uniref:uncharacterized protein n=1 Tax=Nicotiana tomentosiformis TaxID=4098 RepID=UPI00388CA75A
MEIKEDAEKHILWKIGLGRISFWWDNWYGKGALAKVIQFHNAHRKLQVNHFFEGEKWNSNKLRNVLPHNIINDILEIGINIGREDNPIWMIESKGHFTCYSAWQMLRRQRNTSFTTTMIWQKKLPFKISFFMLRMLQNRIPTDGLKRFRLILPSKCLCCNSHKEETTMHLFCESYIAKHVWSFFAQSCGITTRQGDIRQLIMSWWLTKAKNGIHAVILQCLPFIVCWEIWKRNPGSAGGGGVIRDHQGSFIIAFAEYYGQCTNNFAEANAMLHREGNSVADQLANLGESLRVKVTFDTTSSLSDIVRSSLRLDQVGFPNFKFKPRKNHFAINDVSRYS